MKRRARRRWRWRLLAFGVGLGMCLWLGATWLTARTLQHHVRAVQAIAQQTPFDSSAAAELCHELDSAGTAARRFRTIMLPAAPVLRHIGWVPRSGSRLAALPALSDVAAAAADLSASTCTTFAPAFAAFDAPATDRIAVGLQHLHTAPPDWAHLRRDLDHLTAAWNTLSPRQRNIDLLQPYAATLAQFDTVLPQTTAALDLLAALWPAVPALLGLDQPTTLLVLAQNPLELRPTGGFIGTIGTATVNDGRVSNIDLRDSGTLNVAAPSGSAMPAPYAAYLRASQWFARDANWWADGPHSARTAQTFWELNGGPSTDGTVLIDLYALQAVLHASGPVDVPGYGSVSADLETLYALYEPTDQRSTTDKALLAALFGAIVERVPTLAPQQMIGLMAAVQAALDECHITLVLNDETAQTAIAQRHWDGALRPTDGDGLLVVDADLSYSDGQQLIEQQIGLDVEFGATTLTHTLRITYTNGYDDWRADESRHAVYGYCYDPALDVQRRSAGCYGDYVRVYLPASAAPLDLTGADSTLDLGQEDDHATFGWYMLLLPGETRTITLRYRTLADSAGEYHLLVQKQAGTLARPLALTLHTATGSLNIQSDLWHDREFAVGPSLALLSSPEPLHPNTTPHNLAPQAEWAHGWRLWQAGDQAAALDYWASTNTLDRAVGQALALRWRGQIDAAQTLIAALLPLLPADGRTAFIAAQIAQAHGDLDGALRLYERALTSNPASQATRRAIVLLELERGDDQAALAMLHTLDQPLTWLRRLAFDQRYAGEWAAADRTNRLILALEPDDRSAWDERYWLARYATTPDWTQVRDLADQALISFPDDPLWLQRRAEAWFNEDEWALALADVQRVTVISPTWGLGWHWLGVVQRNNGDLAAAVISLERAIALEATPPSDYYVVLAQVYAALGNDAAARRAYTAALQADPQRDDVLPALQRLPEAP